jgi:regulator of sigma E protease
MLTSIVAAVIILGLLIVIHEAGHFVMAKRCGVRVIRFSIGYPPKVWGIRLGETEYALGATPLGGYVRMLGDEIGEEPGPGDTELFLRETACDLLAAANASGVGAQSADRDGQLLALARRFCSPAGGQQMTSVVGATATSYAATPENEQGKAREIFGREVQPIEKLLLGEIDRHGSVEQAVKALVEARPSTVTEAIRRRSFPTQSVGKRILIVLAGPLANFVFAPIGLVIILMYGVPRLLPVVGQVKPNYPAFKAGLHTGDKILAIDGHALKSWDDLSRAVKASGGHALKVELERGAEREVVTLKPVRENEHSLIGQLEPEWIIGVMPRGDTITQRVGPLGAVRRAVVETGDLTAMLVVGIAQIVSGSTPIRQALGGPIMIAQMAGREAEQGFANVGVFTVMLSIELAIINLLPIPLLDGGHLAFFLIEGLRGRPVTLRHREMAQRVGLLVLGALMAFVIFNDILRIVQG